MFLDLIVEHQTVDDKKLLQKHTRQNVGVGLTIRVHSHHEVISHGFGLSQLVGVTVVNHVVTVEAERREDDVISMDIENKLEVLEQKHDRGQNRYKQSDEHSQQ